MPRERDDPHRFVGESTTAHKYGFWDHCILNGWVTIKNMDATFVSTYIRIVDGEERIYTQVWWDSVRLQWRGMLWNYTSGLWEEQAVVASTNTPSGWPGGWTMWETYGFHENQLCPTLPAIRATSVQILLSSGQWTPLSASYSSSMDAFGYCFSNGYYFRRVITPNYTWEVYD